MCTASRGPSGLNRRHNPSRPVSCPAFHFSSLRTRYLGTFVGKTETRHRVSALTDLYKLEPAIVTRLQELEGGGGIDVSPAA